MLPLQACWFGGDSPAHSGVCSSSMERPEGAAVVIHVPDSREELRDGLRLQSLSSSMTQCLLLAVERTNHTWYS